ncbi:hypothetical protein LEP1GSC168_2163 [Leptospira santarosai str. HAI134]|uniref:Uncharacterized protein n=1 Tax=Leptospira santarosai str. ZUN179 TaxID=1049985 RepID=M6V3M5_9LEPT|nr:hypothetical protein LEP1GSC169_3778 [Leptospira santarosai str. HAI1349]EMO21940.1 hypothetical protein LEP1GSC168_2163 [Leptospira santarosai str. HAI134]EMO44103.1 hypothetical protein LEP1GSC187_3389 [Leptospira santarosai str. ZUN179]
MYIESREKCVVRSFSGMKNPILRQTVIDFSNFLQSSEHRDSADYVQI